jgi:preprotein translocase subunit SecF
MLEKYLYGTKINFMKKRKKAFLISGTLILLTTITLILNAFVIPGRGSMLNYGIDFMGGTQIHVKFDGSMSRGKVRKAMKDLGYSNYSVIEFGENNQFMIRLKAFSSISKEKKQKINAAFLKEFSDSFVRIKFSGSGDRLKIRFSSPVDVKEFDKLFKLLDIKANVDFKKKAKSDKKEKNRKRNEYFVKLHSISEKLEINLAKNLGTPTEILSVESRGPQVGKRLRVNGILSILYALGFILLYIVLRFDIKFAPGAIIALVHDVFITVGIFGIFYIEFSLPILAALLTIVGYSLNDTIVVYDRIRENIIKLRSGNLEKVINQSINETLSRTVLTSVTTFLAVFAIFIVSEGVLRMFAFAMGVGVIVGTYSSIFVASPMVLWFDTKFSDISSKVAGKKEKDDEPIIYDDEDKSEKEKSESKPEPTEEEQKVKEIKKAKKIKRKSKGGRGGRRKG